MHYIEDDLHWFEFELEEALIAEIESYLASWAELQRLYGP